MGRLLYCTVTSATVVNITPANTVYGSLHLKNGSAAVTLDVDGITIPVAANETFDEAFVNMASISIANTGSSSMRLLLRDRG